MPDYSVKRHLWVKVHMTGTLCYGFIWQYTCTPKNITLLSKWFHIIYIKITHSIYMWKYKYLNSDCSADSNTSDLNNLVHFRIKKKNPHTYTHWNRNLQVWRWQILLFRLCKLQWVGFPNAKVHGSPEAWKIQWFILIGQLAMVWGRGLFLPELDCE